MVTPERQDTKQTHHDKRTKKQTNKQTSKQSNKHPNKQTNKHMKLQVQVTDVAAFASSHGRPQGWVSQGSCNEEVAQPHCAV
jgi:hypothetical protein